MHSIHWSRALLSMGKPMCRRRNMGLPCRSTKICGPPSHPVRNSNSFCCEPLRSSAWSLRMP